MTKQPKTKRKIKLKKGQKKSDLVWAYVVKNPLAKPAEVARETGVSYAHAYGLMKKIGTPREVFEKEAAVAVVPRAAVADDTSLGKRIVSRLRSFWNAL